ncbi:SH3 domain-containing protein [Deinococcus sp.]|uniref:C40 family peptidase n=1 Tax=Deinococcus sp. TaxID=47478 RepID=UPI003CC6996D
MTPELDPRIHAVHQERGVVEARLAAQFPGYRVLHPRQVQAADQLSLHARPDEHSPQVTEALLGEGLEILEELDGGWAWVRTVHDGYLGYARTADLLDQGGGGLQVRVLRAHVYSAPNVQASVLGRLSFGAALKVQGEPEQHGDYSWWRAAYRDGEGFVRTSATEAQTSLEPLHYLGVPYLWGGRSAWGLDCSGFTQLLVPGLPRDADQQRDVLPSVKTPQPGDLAFFPGHVGLMLDDRRMIHANATRMAVSIDTLGAGDYGRRLERELTGFGRLPIRPGLHP